MLIFLLPTALKVFNTHIVFLVGFWSLQFSCYCFEKYLWKQKSNIRYYRDWGKFASAVFRTDLREALIRVERHDYNCFEQTFLSLLNLHVQMKSKQLCPNHKSYMTKTLCKAIMKRSELASKYHKTKNNKDCNNYKKQINFCSKLY